MGLLTMKSLHPSLRMTAAAIHCQRGKVEHPASNFGVRGTPQHLTGEARIELCADTFWLVAHL